MTRLTNLKSRHTGAHRGRLDSPHLDGTAQGISRARDAEQPWRGWYKLRRWRKLRERVLLRDLYTCQACGKLTLGKGAATVDHRKPHRGDERLFWDESNLQTLCTSPCHVSHKAALEHAQPALRGVWY